MMTDKAPTARDTFHHAAELIATHFVPEEHATATAASFWTIGDIADDAPLSLADLASLEGAGII